MSQIKPTNQNAYTQLNLKLKRTHIGKIRFNWVKSISQSEWLHPVKFKTKNYI